VIAVKIDNIVDARPPDNLTSADIVYLLPVEGGLSRIFAVYSSRIPKVIGPVRSARQDDLALLRQFGRPGFAYSGAAPHLLPFIGRARVVNLYDTPAYFRDDHRVAPHNLYADGRVLRAEAPGPARPATPGSGSARPRPAAGPRHRSACPTRRRRSASAGGRGRTAGWSGWTARRPPTPPAGTSARPP
jgi:hypothetical protein